MIEPMLTGTELQTIIGRVGHIVECRITNIKELREKQANENNESVVEQLEKDIQYQVDMIKQALDNDWDFVVTDALKVIEKVL